MASAKRARLLAAGSLGLLVGCAPPGCRAEISAVLLFGFNGDERSFEAFLDRSVTPRFPEGLTVLDAAGRWRAGDGRMTRERSKVVLIVAEPGAGTVARLEAIRGEYKAGFGQQSVGMVLTPGCADF